MVSLLYLGFEILSLGLAEPLGKPEDILARFTPVLNLINVAPDELNAPASGLSEVLSGGPREYGGLGGIKLRAAVVQFDTDCVSSMLDEDLKLLSRVAMESMVDDVAAAFLQRKR